MDDAHLIDSDSWQFLLNMSVEVNVVTILTSTIVTSMDHIPSPMQRILGLDNTVVCQLDGLSPEEMIKLACQRLNVDSIPDEVEGMIQSRSQGNPLWCLELVEIMLNLNYLVIKGRRAELIQKQQRTGWKSGSSNYEEKPSRQSSKCTLEVASSHLMPSPSPSIIMKPQVSIPVPDSVTGMVLARVDNMSAVEQMTLKCAAVAGVIFKKDLLQSIIPKCNVEMLNKSLDVLAESGLLECAVAARIQRGSQEIISEAFTPDIADSRCACLKHGAPSKRTSSSISLKLINRSVHSAVDTMAGSKEHDSTAVSTQIHLCDTLQFVHSYTQETVYHLWTESQRKKLHEAAARYFQKLAHRCRNCGGGSFVNGDGKPVGRGTPVQDPEAGPVNEDILELNAYSDLIDDVDRVQSVRERPNRAENGIERCLERIYSDNVEALSLRCLCDGIVAYVYPQLIEHWRSAGNHGNIVESLIEGGAAAVTMSKNMQALSMLREAETIMNEWRLAISDVKQGRLFSLIGQVRKLQLYSASFQELLVLFRINLDYHFGGRGVCIASRQIVQFKLLG